MCHFIISQPSCTLQEREIRWDNSPVEEGPECPQSRKQNEFGRHGQSDKLELVLGSKFLREENAGSIGSDNVFERGNEEGEWQTGSVSTEQKKSLERLHKYLRHTLDDHECDVGVRGDTASGTFHVVFRQAFG